MTWEIEMRAGSVLALGLSGCVTVYGVGGGARPGTFYVTAQKMYGPSWVVECNRVVEEGAPAVACQRLLTGDQLDEVAPGRSTSRVFRTSAPVVESGTTQPVLADVAASVLPAEPPPVCGRLVRDGGMTAVHPDGGFRFWGDIKEQRVGGAKPMDIRAFVGAGGVVFRAWVSPGDDLVSAFRFDLGSTQTEVPLDGATRGGGWIEWTPTLQLLHALASGTPRSVLVRTPSEDAWLEIRDEGRPLRDAARCAIELGVVASDG